MVDTVEECSPASIPIFSPTWSEVRYSTGTELVQDGKRINFTSGGAFRFERTTEEFETGCFKLDFRLLFTNPSYYWACFGVACEPNFNGNKGSYYFSDSIMYSSYYPKVTVDHTDLTYKNFSIKDRDLISIEFDIDNSTIQFYQNDQELGVTKVDLSSKKDKSWYFVIGMFEGAAEIVN